MEKIEITSYHDHKLITEVTLPDGKSLNDVKNFSQKYNTVIFDFNDGSSWTCEHDDDSYETEKRPWRIVMSNEQGDELVEEY